MDAQLEKWYQDELNDVSARIEKARKEIEAQEGRRVQVEAIYRAKKVGSTFGQSF